MIVKVKSCEEVLLVQDLRINVETCTQEAHVRLAPGVFPGPTSGVRVSMYDTKGKRVVGSKCNMCVLVV